MASIILALMLIIEFDLSGAWLAAIIVAYLFDLVIFIAANSK